MECVCKVYCETFRNGICNGAVVIPVGAMELPRCFQATKQKDRLPTPEEAVRMAGYELPENPFFPKIAIGTANELKHDGEQPEVRQFASGANRDTDTGKLDYEGFYSPLVMERFAEYMNKNRKLKDGTTRDSDNWQKGIPFEAYMKSMYRHFMDVWMEHRGYDTKAGQEEALCALIFNAQGYLFELLQAKFDEAENDE
jgi:hypothetical protein